MAKKNRPEKNELKNAAKTSFKQNYPGELQVREYVDSCKATLEKGGISCTVVHDSKKSILSISLLIFNLSVREKTPLSNETSFSSNSDFSNNDKSCRVHNSSEILKIVVSRDIIEKMIED